MEYYTYRGKPVTKKDLIEFIMNTGEDIAKSVKAINHNIFGIDKRLCLYSDGKNIWCMDKFEPLDIE